MAVDFDNTEIAFAHRSNLELRKASYIFRIINNPFLVDMGSKATMLALKMRLPIEGLVKNTIFELFCAGTTLLESQKAIDKLARHNSNVILDFGVEAKQTEEDFNRSMRELLRAIQFAANNDTVYAVSIKITGIGRFGLLEKLQQGAKLTENEEKEYENLKKRLDSVCHVAHENDVKVFMDAEESWIQDTIDDLVNVMMERYNKEKVIVYNTFQMYRHDRLAFLKESYAAAEKGGYILGAKLVRGAYMEKERARAEEYDYPSPIQPNKEQTDRDFDEAMTFCVKNYKGIASCAATHNKNSSLLQARLIEELNIPRNHGHISFCQLYGMSDNITFNLANEGYNVAKYLVYGPVKDVIPYLIRRAQENTAVQGDMSRELSLVKRELKRRGL